MLLKELLMLIKYEDDIGLFFNSSGDNLIYWSDLNEKQKAMLKELEISQIGDGNGELNIVLKIPNSYEKPESLTFTKTKTITKKINTVSKITYLCYSDLEKKFWEAATSHKFTNPVSTEDDKIEYKIKKD